MFRISALALAFLPLPALAQAPVCNTDGTQAEMSQCAGDDYAAADAALNTAYDGAMERLRAVDAGLEEPLRGGEDALRAAQRAWITYRDKGCAAEAWINAGGSIQPMVEAQCRTRLTEDRTRELDEIARPM
ncbi:lysozyme inhibitor LprI family protein [Falsirhodobacter halotolerans]|uniref:lysozyme inhibitor LprI family protein n=1 Tax=Falsirhodobacter halotolerans TaxID=1146892 RepID=UPI001FCF82C9|nr:lysozyme inhibitor LprI family protein [Falsirhodobacter halotolerans]MCJ8140151.1 lysozyme inhibitor LprI family protein [Falsirhodobacter halotolerans]